MKYITLFILSLLTCAALVLAWQHGYKAGASSSDKLAEVTRTVYSDTTLWEAAECPDTIAPGVLVHRYHGGSEFPALVEKDEKFIFVSPRGNPMAVEVDSAGFIFWRCLKEQYPKFILYTRYPYECPED